MHLMTFIIKNNNNLVHSSIFRTTFSFWGYGSWSLEKMQNVSNMEIQADWNLSFAQRGQVAPNPKEQCHPKQSLNSSHQDKPVVLGGLEERKTSWKMRRKKYNQTIQATSTKATLRLQQLKYLGWVDLFVDLRLCSHLKGLVIAPCALDELHQGRLMEW